MRKRAIQMQCKSLEEDVDKNIIEGHGGKEDAYRTGTNEK